MSVKRLSNIYDGYVPVDEQVVRGSQTSKPRIRSGSSY